MKRKKLFPQQSLKTLKLWLFSSTLTDSERDSVLYEIAEREKEEKE